MPEPAIFLDQPSVARMLHVSERTLKRWRTSGGGPAFVRMSPVLVIYRQEDIETWVRERTFRSRAEALASQGHSACRGSDV